ncbi:MAG: hypothetical protein IC227_05800 [Enterococcus lacertideformus]|uniref:Uncharacterized protein n=1 Tax=Enterococcus lacertideformus TaxID=2771493 RepID=A0A931AYY3_9ENTE|nr:hypothetical protein [Enterococcus lacertideformus]
MLSSQNFEIYDDKIDPYFKLYNDNINPSTPSVPKEDPLKKLFQQLLANENHSLLERSAYHLAYMDHIGLPEELPENLKKEKSHLFDGDTFERLFAEKKLLLLIAKEINIETALTYEKIQRGKQQEPARLLADIYGQTENLSVQQDIQEQVKLLSENERLQFEKEILAQKLIKEDRKDLLQRFEHSDLKEITSHDLMNLQQVNLLRLTRKRNVLLGLSHEGITINIKAIDQMKQFNQIVDTELKREFEIILKQASQEFVNDDYDFIQEIKNDFDSLLKKNPQEKVNNIDNFKKIIYVVEVIREALENSPLSYRDIETIQEQFENKQENQKVPKKYEEYKKFLGEITSALREKDIHLNGRERLSWIKRVAIKEEIKEVKNVSSAIERLLEKRAKENDFYSRWTSYLKNLESAFDKKVKQIASQNSNSQESLYTYSPIVSLARNDQTLNQLLKIYQKIVPSAKVTEFAEVTNRVRNTYSNLAQAIVSTYLDDKLNFEKMIYDLYNSGQKEVALRFVRSMVLSPIGGKATKYIVRICR